MKVALAQTNIIWENKTQNILNAEKNVVEVVKKNVDMILFPEMSFSGFSMNTNITGEKTLYTLDKMSKIAKDNAINIGFGWVEKFGTKNKNTYSIVDENGNVVSSYVKIHPFSYSGEDKLFCAGKEIVTFFVKKIPFSVFICYDLRFPELFRIVSDDVHAIIIPACWPEKRSEHWKALLRARAIENQVYIFAINCQGDIGGLYYSGDSCVINPNGEVLEMLSNEEGIVIFDFDDDVEDYREKFPVLNDRRVEINKCLI